MYYAPHITPDSGEEYVFKNVHLHKHQGAGLWISRLNCTTPLPQDVPDSLVFGKTYDKGGFQRAVENNILIFQKHQSSYMNSSRTHYETPFGTILGFSSIYFTECLLSLHSNQPFECQLSA